MLLLAPASNVAWGVNGFRTVSAPYAAAVLAGAGLAAALAIVRLRARVVWVVIAVAVPLVVAFAMPESIHLLGDTQLRFRAMIAFSDQLVAQAIGTWAGRLHAHPLDVLVNVFAPVALDRSGLTIRQSLGVVGALLGVAAFAGAWRLAGRLGAPRDARLPVALVLVLTGTLQGFAGYAESAGLLAATAFWWWAELLAPLDRPRAAWRTCAAWLLMVLGHRVALAMLLPQLWRAVGPPLPDDRPAGRRTLLFGTVGVAAALVAIGFATDATGRLQADVAEMLQSARSGEAMATWPWDPLNALLLVAPLAFLAPAFSGGQTLGGFVRDPRVLLVAVAVMPLLGGLMFLFPAGGGGLGLHRDWDSAILAGIALTVGAAALLVRLPVPRLRGALVLALPVTAVISLGWVAANAEHDAALRRAVALLESPALPAVQRSHLHLWFAQRAMDQRSFEEAGQHYGRAFELVRNPRRALLAAEAWAMAGDAVAARDALARARATGRMTPELEQGATRLENMMAAPSSPGP